MTPQKALALVIGLCSHGIAMTRALKKNGVKVYAFESNREIPGVYTNSSEVIYVKNINTKELINDLLKFRNKIDSEVQIVLFPTNDNNVRILGENLDEISMHFLLSWKGCAAQVLSLLKKSSIEQRCFEAGIRYPKSTVLNIPSDVQHLENVEYPVLIKPVTPQSSFKALKCDSYEQLNAFINKYQNDLPILMQPWISGTDRDLFFCALYLDNGEVLSELVGNKVESYPPARGQTTVAITCDNKEVLEITKAFFAGLNISGPVSLELKKDELGRYWIIEPTVGRTDFWFGLCVKSGQNLIFIEFLRCIGNGYQPIKLAKPVIWFDSEKDILACLRNFKFMMPFLGKMYWPTFSYVDATDIRPFFKATENLFSKVKNKVLKKNSNKYKEFNDTYRTFDSIESMPEDAKALLSSPLNSSIFLSSKWYTNFSTEVASKSGDVKYLVIFNAHNLAIAVIPLWLKTDGKWFFKKNTIRSLTNYYSPTYDVNWHTELTTYKHVMVSFMAYLDSIKKQWDIVELSPIIFDTKSALLDSCALFKFNAFAYKTSINLYQSGIVSFDSYINARPSKLRNIIKRKTKKLTKDHQWGMELFTSFGDVSKHISSYHEVYEKSWKVNEPFPNFVTGLVKLGAKMTWSRLGILSVDGTAVGAQIWLVHGSTAYIYKLAYDKDYSAYSPGSILTEFMVKQVLENDKVTVIDFLTGDDDYKNDWMSEWQELYGVQICNPANIFGILKLLINTMSEFKHRLGFL